MTSAVIYRWPHHTVNFIINVRQDFRGVVGSPLYSVWLEYLVCSEGLPAQPRFGSSRIRELVPKTEAKHHRTLMQALLFCTRLKRKGSKVIKAHKANRKQRVERICFFVCLFSSLSFCLCVFFIICLSFVQKKKLGSSTGHALEWLMYFQIQRKLHTFVEFWHVFRAGLQWYGNDKLSLPVNGFYIFFSFPSFGAWRWVQWDIILSVTICGFKQKFSR